jgi:superfamily II DNA or RNA helicase
LPRVGELREGVYDHLVTEELATDLLRIDAALVKRVSLDPAEAADTLARHIGRVAKQALSQAGDLAAKLAETNRIVAAIGDVAGRVVDDDHLLTAITRRPPARAAVRFPQAPITPLSVGALLVNGPKQPQIGPQVKSETASADRVDLLCAFIKWHGVRIIEEQVKDLIARGGSMRVITTTYLGATDQRALDKLAELGAQIKVSYETRTTRLHAKAWLFHRESGATTGYVGSSNLSRAALLDGVEWNVRLSELEQPYIVETFRDTFDDYWTDEDFEDYQPATDRERLRRALAAERGDRPDGDLAELIVLDVRPYPYQQTILEELTAARELHGHRRNLVVMATGTGKTVVAAMDYRDLRRAGKVESLLFVAHQERILKQSQSVFRHVLRDGTFGERFVGGERPTQWRHVFASIQSLHRMDEIDPAMFDMVIVDEFHHAEARTYTDLLRRLQPRELLGLTATPDRADGQDVRRWFDGRTAVELHLWQALERQHLAPFQYFGIHDDVDLSTIQWRRGGYDEKALSELYTGHHARAALILKAVADKVDVGRMRAVAFCVSVQHAEFMADRFNAAGVRSRAVTSRASQAERDEAIAAFQQGEIKTLFTVDLFNEGVDLPMIDTILMLRPTESATIFLQQLGRGLRLADGKPCLTVLDFIGGQHANFRFDLRWRALAGISRQALAREIENDFPTLPSGCHIALDRVAKDVVLTNLRNSLPSRSTAMAAELKRLGDVSLSEFLADTGLELEDLYRRRALRGWTGLRRRAELPTPDPGPNDTALASGMARLLHVDDLDRIAQIRALVEGRLPRGRAAAMLHFALWGSTAAPSDLEADLTRLLDDDARRAELAQLADILHGRIRRVTHRHDDAVVPLHVHARYSRDEACAAFGIERPDSVREGVKWVEAERADIFFVTLVKTDRHYSPTTMYQDRAITPRDFQWESQSGTKTGSPTGQRYINHVDRGSTVHLFVRESKESEGDLPAPPYLYAGPMTYVSHTGEKPMRIIWRLAHALPGDVYHAARVAAA